MPMSILMYEDKKLEIRVDLEEQNSYIKIFKYNSSEEPYKLLAIETSENRIYVDREGTTYYIESKTLAEMVRSLTSDIVKMLEQGKHQGVLDVLEDYEKRLKEAVRKEREQIAEVFDKIVEKIDVLASILAFNMIKGDP